MVLAGIPKLTASGFYKQILIADAASKNFKKSKLLMNRLPKLQNKLNDNRRRKMTISQL
jgi:hypothetical protein